MAERLAIQGLALFCYLTSLLAFFSPLSHHFSLLKKGMFFLIYLFSVSFAIAVFHAEEKALHSENIRLIYTAVIRPLDLKQFGTRN